MKNSLLLIAAFAFSAPILSAQQLSDNKSQTTRLIAAGNLTTGSNQTVDRHLNFETPEQARSQVVAALNLLRGYSVSAGTLTSSTSTDDRFVKSDAPQVISSPDSDNPSGSSFSDYVDKMNKVLARKLANLDRDTGRNKEEQKSKLIRAITLLKSANCLVNKSDGTYIKMKDLDGYEIIAFPVDNLKTNSRYGFVEGYKEGFARIKKDQVFGYLNYCGDEIIPCQYENAQPFNDGRALVKKVDWYFIDPAGNESNTLDEIADAQAITHGISLVRLKNGKSTFINNRYDDTRVFLSAQYDEITPFYKKDIFKVRSGKSYGLINLNGTVKLEALYDDIQYTNTDNLFKVFKGGKVGLMDSLWKIRFTPTFDAISDFNKYGLAIAREGESVRMINHNTFKSSLNYQSVGEFNAYGMAFIKSADQKYGFIDTALRIIVTPLYSSIGDFNQYGLAPACKDVNGKCGFINLQGKEIILPIYEEVGKFTSTGLVVVRELTKDCNKNKTCKTDVVYETTGKVVIGKPAMSEVSTMKIHYEIVDSVLHSDKYIPIKTFVDEKEEGFHLVEATTFRQVTAVPYEMITPYDINGFFRVRKDGLWGLMDTAGKVLTKIMYKEIKKPTEGYYAVKNELDQYGFMDKKGKIQIPFDYTDVKQFKNGYAMASKGKEKWGLINRFNAKIVPCVFKSVNILDRQYELIDATDQSFLVNDKGDCEKNCQKFEEIRRKANQR